MGSGPIEDAGIAVAGFECEGPGRRVRMEPKGQRRHTGYLPFVGPRENGASDLVGQQRAGAKAHARFPGATSQPLDAPSGARGSAGVGSASRRRTLLTVGAITSLIVTWTLADFFFESL